MHGQDKGYDFQSYMIGNPSAAGSEGSGTIRFSYLNYYPGNAYKLHNFTISYDSFIQALHGGLGLYLSDYYQGGIVNDISGGFSYSYHFRAGNEVFIRAGLSSGFFHRGYSSKGMLLPEQIDPLGGPALPASEIISVRNRAVFDLSSGFMLDYKNMSAGVSVSHLTEPEIAEGKGYGDRLRRNLSVFITADFNILNDGMLILKPVFIAGLSEDLKSLAAGSVVSMRILSVSAVFEVTDYKDLDLQSGISFSAGGIRFYYNYRFNLAAGYNLVPLPIFHQTGMCFSLNNVDKRKTVKTIIFPEL